MSRIALLLLGIGGCAGKGSDTDTGDPSRILTTATETFDAGIVAVNDRYTLTIYLESVGEVPVTVFDVYTEDDTDPNWVVLDTWATGTTATGGETVPSLFIDSGTSDSPSYAPVEVSFRPTSEGAFRETLIVESNDSVATDVDPETGYKILKLLVRGLARSGCAYLSPSIYDFGTQPIGSTTEAYFDSVNCGVLTLTVDGGVISGDSDFSFTSPVPNYSLPGNGFSQHVSWTPSNTDLAYATLSLITNDPNLSQTVTLIGNDPTAATYSTDNDGDGYTEMDGDCNDANADISPAATEIADEIDNNCNGMTDEGTDTHDDDGDGYAEIDDSGNESDCDDTDPWVYPGATEDCDGVDNDCDGLIDEGSDDTENGACAFLVERTAESVTAAPKGCTGTGEAWPGALGVCALAFLRRRRSQRRP